VAGVGVGTALAKTNWTTGGYTLPCLSCHDAAQPATQYASGTGVAAPAKDQYFATRGHGLPSGQNYPWSSARAGANATCSNCHNSASDHISGTLGDSDRLTTPGNAGCNACHDGPGAGSAVSQVSTHANSSTTMASKYTKQRNYFELNCVECHDVHGSTNIFMVTTANSNGPLVAPRKYNNATYPGADDLTTFLYRGAVSFTDDSVGASATAGVGYANPSTPSGDASKICQTCHTLTVHFQWNSNDGHINTDCIVCHKHDIDATFTAASQDGFMPAGCNGCHGFPPVKSGETGGNPDYVVENYAGGGGQHKTHVEFLKSKVPVGDAASPKALCGPCHGDNSGDSVTGNHNGSNKGANAWLETQARNYVNIRSRASGQDSWGASATYNGILLTTGNAAPPADAMDANGTDNRCANVDCHGSPKASDTVEVLHWNVDLTADAPGGANNGKEKSRTCEGCHDETPAQVRVYAADGSNPYTGNAPTAAANYYATRSGYGRGGHGDAAIQTEIPAPGASGRPDATGTTPVECTACHSDAAPHFPEDPANLHRLTVIDIENTAGTGLCNTCHARTYYPGQHHPSLRGTSADANKDIYPLAGQEILTVPSSWNPVGGEYEQNGYSAVNVSGSPDFYVNWWGATPGNGNQDPPPQPVPFSVLPLRQYIGNQSGGVANAVMCVTCHNPHGTDLFVYDPAGTYQSVMDNNMLRAPDSTNVLCNACH
jgi:hypothetical protein